MSRNKISIEDLTNNFLQLHKEDSILSNVKRNKVLLVIRRGVRKFSRSIGSSLKAVQIDVINNMYIPYPSDYIDYIRLSVLDRDGYLQVIKFNEKIPIAFAQLKSSTPDQDGNFPKLFDQDGIELLSSSLASFPNFQSATIENNLFEFLVANFPYNSYGKETGNNAFGEFRPDDRNNRFVVTLTPNQDYDSIILEYVADPTMVSETEDRTPTVSISLEELLYAFTYHELVAIMPNVPAVEKQRAKMELIAAKRRAKIDAAANSLDDLLHALRYGSKQVAKF